MLLDTCLLRSDKHFDNKMVWYVTMIIMVLRIVELLIDPLIGNAIDRTNTRVGERNLNHGLLVVVLFLPSYLPPLFTPLGGLNTSNPVLYLIIFAIIYIVMDVFYSFNDVGFWSMVPAMSFDSHERDKIATFARVGSTIGGQIIGFVIMPMVLFFSVNQNGGTGDDRGWFIFAAIVAAISAITAIGVGIFTHEQKSLLRENKEQTKFKDILKILVKNDQLAIAICLIYSLLLVKHY